METNDLKQRLIEQRQRLQHDRDSSEDSDTVGRQQEDHSGELSTFDGNPADQGTETVERERALAVIEQIDARIEEVDAALARLEEGVFGRCGVCGEPIPEERLAARPEARYCVAHQEEVERGERPSPSA